MPNNIAVTITANVADLTAKRAILSAELKAAQRDLNDFAKTARTTGVTNELRTGMLSSAEAVAKARAEVTLLDREMKNLSGTTTSTRLADLLKSTGIGAVGQAAGGVPIFGQLAAGLTSVGPAALGAAAAIGLVATAVEQTRKAADWAEDLKRTSDALGISTKALQEFDFVAQATGIPVASMRSSIQGLAETIGKVQDNLVRGKAGAQVKVFELIFGVDDPEKAKADLREMGGSIDAILPKILDLSAKLTPTGRAGLAQALRMDPEVLNSLTEARGRISDLNDEMKRYGIIADDSVINRSAEAAEKMHVVGAVVNAELRQAFLNLAPAVAGAAQMVEKGSKDFADMTRGVVVAVGGVRDFVGGVDSAIKPLGDLDKWLGSVTGGFGGLWSMLNHIINPLSQVVDLFKQLGRQGSIHDDIDAGLKAGASVVAGKPKVDPELEKLIEGLGKTGGRKGGNKGANQAREMADSDAQTELAIQKAALEDQKGAVEAAYRDEIGSAQAKHDQLVAIAKQEAADEVAAQQAKIDAAGKDVVQAHAAANQILVIQADLKAKIDGLDRQLTEDKKREEERRVRDAKAAEAERLSEIKNNLATDQQIRKTQEGTAESQIRQQGKGGGVLGEVQAEQQIAALHRQVMQQEIAETEQTYALEDAARQQDIAKAKAAGASGAEAYRALTLAKEKADNEFYNKHRELEAQMVAQEQADAQRIQQAWHSIVDPMVQTTGQNIKGLIEGTETWGQALRNIGEEALNLVIDAIERMVEAWIINMLTGQAASKTNAVSQIGSYAGIAFSSGVASMAGAPFPLDLNAPEFGAAMAETAFAGGMAFASFDRGADVLPADMIAQVHAGERIIPAAQNSEIMAAVARGTSTTNNRGGDINQDFGVHLHGVGGGGELDGKAVIRALHREQASHAKLLKGMHRNGHFAFAR